MKASKDHIGRGCPSPNLHRAPPILGLSAGMMYIRLKVAIESKSAIYIYIYILLGFVCYLCEYRHLKPHSSCKGCKIKVFFTLKVGLKGCHEGLQGSGVSEFWLLLQPQNPKTYRFLGSTL